MAYDELSDEQLAKQVSKVLGLNLESARRAIKSTDPDLGRAWAISLLERENQHEKVQARLTEHRESLRSVASGV
jgi:hypothetical protein